MSIIQACGDTKDCVDLFRPQRLYLKPIARINVSVQLPQLKKSGAKISNWEVMEKIKEMGRPFTFPVFKVSKSSLEFIRFECEIDNYGSMENVLAKLDMKTVKLAGFTELLKVRAAEAKMPYPTRADWDSFFRENKEMNEMKAGERPDTIKIENLPCKWFVNYQDKSGLAHDKPSEFVLKKAFQSFGEIRIVDIPMLDAYRHKMKKSLSGGIKTFSFGQDLVFEAFIQFKEYIGFVKAMNAMKGMKLCYKDRDSEKAWNSNIKVEFDKSKHLAEATVKQRKAERERIVGEEREKERQEKRKAELEEMQKNQQMKVIAAEEKERSEKNAAKDLVKSQRRIAREAKRKGRAMARLGLTEEEEMNERIGMEERKLVLAQRKLESIRMLDELLERVKASSKGKNEIRDLERQMLKAHKKDVTSQFKHKKESGNLKDKEKEIREKLVAKLKAKAESSVSRGEGRVTKAKAEELSPVSDEELSEELEDVSEDSDIGDVSEDEVAASSDNSEDLSEIDSDEELRLTSTDEEGEKKGAGGRKGKRSREEKEKVRERKVRGLQREIARAERVAARERAERKRSPVRREVAGGSKREPWEYRGERERTPTGYYSARDYYDRRKRGEDMSGKPETDFEREERNRREFLNSTKIKKVNRFLSQSGMRKEQVEAEMERAYEKYFSSLSRKEDSRARSVRPMTEQDLKEEQWERMQNPHLFGGTGGGGYRKVKLGQHYEEVQKEVLQTEIRIRERREQSMSMSRDVRTRDRERTTVPGSYGDRFRASSSRSDRW